MHAIALAILPHLAVGTFALLGPCAVAELLKTVLPHIPEVILVDITLCEVGPYARTSRYVAIDTYRGYAHASITFEGVGAYLQLVASQETLATVARLDASLIACALDKLHHGGELLVVKLQ